MKNTLKPPGWMGSLLLIGSLFLFNYQIVAQGRFVRGVEKVEYDLTAYDADFYVSPSGVIPGLAQKLDIGLAGGSYDQQPYTVIFEDFQLIIETNGTEKK